MSNEIEARRQRAREAAQDEIPPAGISGHGNARIIEDAVEAAIETATRVKITDEALDYIENTGDIHDGLAAALTALGFEVEK